jgi:hypothetical protein
MIRRLRAMLTGPEPEEFIPGDFVRRVGECGTGIVESVSGDHAIVAWDKDRRDILSFFLLRRVKQRGQAFDTRRGRE